MPHEPHTDCVDPDETIELPWDAAGVTVERDGDEYVVHYLTRVRSDDTPIQQQVRERLKEYEFDEPDERHRKAREIRESIRDEESRPD